MAVNNYLKKFKLVLENVLEGKIVLSETQAEKLEDFLQDRRENSPGRLLLDTPSFSDLLFDSLNNISKASTSIKILIVKIVTILYKSELHFTKMRMQGFENSTYLLSAYKTTPPLNLHLACVKLATAQVSHSAGLKLILQQKVWEKALFPNIHLSPKPISSSIYNLIAKLVWKLDDHNLEPELLEVLTYVVTPIVSTEYRHVQNMDAETDTLLTNKIFSHMSALLAVMSEVENNAPVNKVMPLLKNYYMVKHIFFDIYDATKNPCLLQLLNSCVIRYCFGSLRYLLFEGKSDEFCHKVTTLFRNYLVKAIQKREAIAIVDFAVQASVIWSNFQKSHASIINAPLTFINNNKQMELPMHMIVPLLVPILKYYVMYRVSKNLVIIDVLELFTMKFGFVITDYMFSCCYSFSGLIEECDEPYRKRVTTQALKDLLRLKGHINISQAGGIFLSLYYLLEVYILCDESGKRLLNEEMLDLDDLRMLSHLLDAMKMLLKEYHISWYETVEVVSVQADLLTLLRQNFLTTKHVVQILDLLNICVRKFLSPNMSLLIESKPTQDSTLNEIGEVIKLFAQHDDWEVRDSAFNLLNSCTEISYIKYDPFRGVIKSNSLIYYASNAAMSDPEFYPQCTALKCLTAASKIDELWHEILAVEPQFYVQLVRLIRNHPEGIVRKEAVNVLTGVYVNRKVASDLCTNLYEVMITVALDDLHWEVQLAALNFWKVVIDSHLTSRGMLDGTFPSVTFSKQKRKIVVLNDAEIQRQLTSFMNELSNIGCLTVLVECMNEIHNLEVMDQAYGIAKELIRVLDEYKFKKEITCVKSPVSLKNMEVDNNVPIDLSFNEKVISEEEKDRVIDEMLSVDQSELIINLHNNYNPLKLENMDIDCPSSRRRDLLNTQTFLGIFSQNDFSSLIEDKKRCNADCVSSLDGLLDEILDL